MQATLSFAFNSITPDSPSDEDTRLVQRYRQGDSSAFLALIRKHHRPVFHLSHALLRDEVAAEKITQQVFARARRQLDRTPAGISVGGWLYYASLRFARSHYWHTRRLLGVHRLPCTAVNEHPALDLKVLASVIAALPDKIEPRDCELLALRHVLGLSLNGIAQLLRIHPYEASNRLIWARERVMKLSQQHALHSESAHPFLAMSA